MPEIDISEDLLKRVRAFKKVIDVLIEDTKLDIPDCVNLIIRVGIEKMLRDVIPEAYTEEGVELLRVSIVEMFKEDPDFVADFVVKMMKRGTGREEEVEEERERWMEYIG